MTTFVMEYAVVAEGRRIELRARATLVLAKDDGAWLIVHEHLSPFAGND